MTAVIRPIFAPGPCPEPSMARHLRSFLFSLLLGRFFCGWLCPLGTVLDLVTKRVGRSATPRTIGRSVKYWLLLPLVGAALAKLNIAGLLDPLAILLRGLTFALHPLLGEGVRGGWRSLYGLVGDRRDLLDPGAAAAQAPRRRRTASRRGTIARSFGRALSRLISRIASSERSRTDVSPIRLSTVRGRSSS